MHLILLRLRQLNCVGLLSKIEETHLKWLCQTVDIWFAIFLKFFMLHYKLLVIENVSIQNILIFIAIFGCN
jgi:hypothetical protein